MARDDVKAAGQLIAAMTAAGFDRDEIGRTVAACFPGFSPLHHRLARAMAGRCHQACEPAAAEDLADFITSLLDERASPAVIAEALHVFRPYANLAEIAVACANHPVPVLTGIVAAWRASREAA